MNFRAVIFDMDGVLVDSELHWEKVEKELWGRLGITMLDEFRKKILGLKTSDILELARKSYGLKVSPGETHRIYNNAALPVYEKYSSLLPGVTQLLSKLQARGATLAIASSSPELWIDTFLRRFSLHDVFPRVFSAETLGVPGKPDPAIYTHTMREMSLRPEDTVIIEDSTNGFQAALASGAATVAVPDPRWSRGDFSAADLVISSLQDKKLYDFLGL